MLFAEYALKGTVKNKQLIMTEDCATQLCKVLGQVFGNG